MKLRHETLVVHPRYPFRIARGVQTEREVLIVELEWEGLVGFGEASPPPYYGEDATSARRALDAVAGELEGSPDSVRERLAGGDLRTRLAGAASVRAALDMALWDLKGKREGRALFHLLGLDSAATPATSMSIGIDAPQIVDRKVDEASSFRILKMKMGVPGDMALLDRVLARSQKTIRVDANEGWDVETAIEMARALNDRGIELIEQPIHHERRDDLRTLKRLSPVPIVLDESVVDPGDATRCRDEGHGINIKLMKCGGITPALDLIAEARDAGLKIMLGCMLETSVAITAAAHISPLVDYADLDGNLLLADDPFVGVTVQNGKLVLPDSPGLGVSKRQ